MTEDLIHLDVLSNTELKELVDDLQSQETLISRERRILHAKLDLLRTEMVTRLRKAYTEGRLDISNYSAEELVKLISPGPRLQG